MNKCKYVAILTVILVATMITPIYGEKLDQSTIEIQSFPLYHADFNGNFSISGPFAVNETTTIIFTICPTMNSYNTTIRFVLPMGVELSEGKLEWNLGDVKEGEKKEVTISVRPLEDILHRNIHAFVRASTSPNLSEEVERSYACSVSTTTEGVEVTEDNIVIRQKASIKVTLSDISSSSITVHGTLKYRDESWLPWSYSPIRFARVVLYDTDEPGGVDERITDTFTDENGRFSFTVDNNDGPGEGGRDVYIEVEAFSTAASVENAGGVRYTWRSSAHINVSDGANIEINMNINDYAEALQAMDAVIEEYEWIKDKTGGWTRPQVIIKWPTGNWAYSTGNEILLCSKAIFDWNHVTVYHEYGHCVMYTAYGNRFPPGAVVPDHTVVSETNPGFAFTEGWAEFMQCAVDNNPRNLADVGGNIEENDWYNYLDRGDMDGEIIEGSVASVLWDIYDPANDDDIPERFDYLWSIIETDNPDDIIEFLDHWFNRNYDYGCEITAIYHNYGVNTGGELQAVSIPKSYDRTWPWKDWHEYYLGDILNFVIKVRNPTSSSEDYQLGFLVYDENQNLLTSWSQYITVPANGISNDITLEWLLDSDHGVDAPGIYKVKLCLWKAPNYVCDCLGFYDYRIIRVGCEDKYDVKFWFKPGNEPDAPFISDPEHDFLCIRDWVDHLCMQYWNKWHSEEIYSSSTGSLDIRTDKVTYTVGEPITFRLNITNSENVSRTVDYNISIESKDPESESALREVHQTLTGSLTLPPNSTDVYNVTTTVSSTLRFGRVIYAVAEVDGEKAVTTFRVRPAYDLAVDYDLVEGEPGEVRLSITNNGSTVIKGINATLDTFYNIEVLEPTQTLASLAVGETENLTWNVNCLSPGFSMLYFDITTDNAGSGKVSMPVHIIGKPKLNVELESQKINFGEPTTITAYISNFGDIGLTNVSAELRLSEGIETSDMLVKTIGALDGGATKEVSWTINGTAFGNHLISVLAKDGEFNATAIATITVVEGGHDIKLTIEDDDEFKHKDTFKETPVEFEIEVKNLGSNADVVDIYVYPNGTNWTCMLYDGGNVTLTSPYKVELPPHSSRILTLNLTPHAEEDVGSRFDVEVLGISEKDSSKYDRVFAEVSIVSVTTPVLSVIPTSVDLTIEHNSSESFNITVSNEGGTTLNNIVLTSTGAIAPWTTLSKTHIPSLEPGRSENVSVTIKVPKYQAPDTYTGAINITSDDGGSASVQVSVTVPESYEVDSSVSPTYNAVEPGDTAIYNVSINNEGNVVDTYSVSVENSTRPGVGNISGSWVSADRATTTLEPGESDIITLEISPPRRWDTSPGIYPFVVNVSSNHTYDLNEADLEVLPFHDVDLDIRSSHAVNPRLVTDDKLVLVIKKNPEEKIPVIIRLREKLNESHERFIESIGGTIKYKYHLINATAADIPVESIPELAVQDFVEAVEEDFKVKATLDVSVPSINVSYVRSIGLDGSGVDVAVVDTGIDYNHTAFRNIGIGYDFVRGDNYAEDENGHGTHVAGIIASNDPTYGGVAPNATIMPIKVLDETGTGNASTVIAGIEWAVDHGAEVICLSLGGPGGDGTSSLSRACDEAVAKGVVVVAAAGNDGPSPGTITSPGDARDVITVGAIDDHNTVPDWSSRGPTTDGRTKPDVVAPGVDITSCALGGGFTSKSGTSMSTPHVAGAAALLVQAYHPAPEQIKEAFKETAIDLGYDNNTQGAGKIDVDGAYFYLASVYRMIIQEVMPGGTARFNYVITNLGNIEDTFNVTLIPQDFGTAYEAYPTQINLSWVNLTSSVSLIPGNDTDECAEIVVPVSWAGMENATYRFTIKVNTGNPGASDSEDSAIVVIATKRSMTEYIGLELEELTDDVGALVIDDAVKDSLLYNILTASYNVKQAIYYISYTDNDKANDNLNAADDALDAFIDDVQSYRGNEIVEEEANELSIKATKIKEHIAKAIDTPVPKGSIIRGNRTVIAITEPDIEKVTFQGFSFSYTTWLDIAEDTDGDDGWSAMIDFSVFPDGPYYLRAVATDTKQNNWYSNPIMVLLDNTPPTIESVVLEDYTSIPNAIIHITVNATDNVGVSAVTADGVNLEKIGSTWEGNITAPSVTGDYTLTIIAEDAAGNFAETSVNYSVVKPSGSVGIGVEPRLTTVSAGDTAIINIKLVSTENFDDIAYVYLTTEGVYPGYEANLTWFNWSSKYVKVPAGSVVKVPIEVSVPTGESGYKVFYAKFESKKWTPTSMDTGVLYIT